MDNEQRQQLRENLGEITRVRDRLHLDTYNPNERIDFHMDYLEPFFNSHLTLKDVLEKLGDTSRLEGSCLFVGLEKRSVAVAGGAPFEKVFVVERNT